jgi:hypothetical protein
MPGSIKIVDPASAVFMAVCMELPACTTIRCAVSAVETSFVFKFNESSLGDVISFLHAGKKKMAGTMRPTKHFENAFILFSFFKSE